MNKDDPFDRCIEVFLDGETKKDGGHEHERVQLSRDSQWLTVWYEHGDTYNYAISKIAWTCCWQYTEIEQGGE